MKKLLSIIPTLTFAVLLSGCGSSENELSQEDYERADAALKKALSEWKSAQPAAKWRHTKAPIRFVDEHWLRGYRLVDFDVTKIRANRDGYAEGIVRLSLKYGNSPTVEREVLYNINVKKQEQVVISREPMY